MSGYGFGTNYLLTHTVPKHKLGDERKVKGVGTFKYVKASAAFAVYAAVKVDDDGTAAGITTTISGSEPTLVGFAQVAFAINAYGWVFIGEGGGSGVGIKVLAQTLCAADAKLYTTGTAGEIDDTATDLIQGVKLITTNAAGGTVATEVYAVSRMTTNAQD